MTDEVEHSITPITLRIPRGLWKDLEETVIQQDRQFLTEVARSLGLPVKDTLRLCLGTGAPQVIPVLWGSTKEEEQCPWWELYGEGLWRPCPRLRLTSTHPCQKHAAAAAVATSRLSTDPFIQALPLYHPVRHDGVIYWINRAEPAVAYTEDGLQTEGFRYIKHRGKRGLWKLPKA
jgi:hypothetical protein